MSIFSLHNCFVEIPLRGMELRHSLLSGGMNMLTVRKLHKPPHVEKQINSIPRRGIYRIENQLFYNFLLKNTIK